MTNEQIDTMTDVDAVDDVVDADDHATALDDIVDGVDGVTGALLATVDGFTLARSRSMREDPAHAAVVAAGIALANQLASISGGQKLRQFVVDHDGGLILVRPMGERHVLALITIRTVDQQEIIERVRVNKPALRRSS